MRKSPSIPRVPIPVARALRKLGHDIRDARRRRRTPVALLAERAPVTRMTLNKTEKRDAGWGATRLASNDNALADTRGPSDSDHSMIAPDHSGAAAPRNSDT